MMSNLRNSIKCHCGQRVMARDVMQTGYYLRLFGPSFVYVKYRCSRCKKLGEQFIKQEEWDSGILRDASTEIATDDKEHFEALGPIDINEVIDFHFALEEAQDLKGLDMPGSAKKVKQRSQ
jgi:DNA-directed RNA polymerase subunit RPC12/RpoP